MSKKQRLSASVDEELIRAGEIAVARGRSDSLSAWVNEALRLKLVHDRRLEALAQFVHAYELERGEITPDELRLAARRARSRSITVRGKREPSRAKPRGGRAG